MILWVLVGDFEILRYLREGWCLVVKDGAIVCLSFGMKNSRLELAAKLFLVFLSICSLITKYQYLFNWSYAF